MSLRGGSARIENVRQPEFLVADWRVVPQEDLLSRGDEQVHLEPKAMEVLVYLATRPGAVVSRADLEEAVWRGALVGYDAVTSTVIKLRKALGDDAREPRFIATIPKRGYKLIAAVTPLEAESSATNAAAGSATPTAPTAPTVPSGRRRAGWLGVGLLLVATLAVALFVTLRAPTSDNPPAVADAEATTPPSIVVLPFENLSENPDQEVFADGITEDIITDLSGLSNLLVIASNTAFSFKGKQVSVQDVATDLKVDFVLEGSIRRYGNSVRVNAQLVDTETGFQRWANRYDRRVDEIFAVQDELTSSIVEALLVKLNPQEQERLAKRTTNNLAAYDHFQQGQRLIKVVTRETNAQAQVAYRKAIELDPGYGRAYGALAYAVGFTYRRGWNDAPVETIDRALELAKKGVELNSSIPQTYWALAWVHLMRREFDQAKAVAAESIAISPNYADGYGLLALISNSLGEPESAVELIKKGMKLNPYYTWDYPYNLGRAYYHLDRVDEAIVALEQARARNENAIQIRLYLAASYARAGRQDDAEWEVEEMQVLNPTETISFLRNTMALRNERLANVLFEDLRKAGLPE